MKKSAVISIIAGFALVIVGVVTVITSFAMGVKEQIRHVLDIKEIEGFVIYSETYEDITSMDFDINAADLKITEGDEFSIEYSRQDNADFKTYVDEYGIWHINGSLFSKDIRLSNFISWIVNSNNQTVYITIPKNTNLADMDIRINAGNVEWDTIECDSCKIDVNAGNIEINKIAVNNDFAVDCKAGNIEVKSCTAENLNMSVDVGNIEVENCSSSNIYMSVDAGNVDWSGDVVESIEVDNDMGNVVVCLPGSTKNYNIYAESDMGSLILNDKDYSGVDKTISINNNAAKK